MPLEHLLIEVFLSCPFSANLGHTGEITAAGWLGLGVPQEGLELDSW